MKFDINTPAELSEAELETVYGGWNGGYNGPGSSAAAAGALATSYSERVHSFSLLCDISIYSLNAQGLIVNAINIASPVSQTCVDVH